MSEQPKLIEVEADPTIAARRPREGTLAEVLAGSADWCVVEGDCAEVMPDIPERGVAHVITDPPYEAEAHSLQRRVKNGERTSRWGGGGQSTCATPPSRSSRSARSNAGRRDWSSLESRRGGSLCSVRWRPR